MHRCSVSVVFFLMIAMPSIFVEAQGKKMTKIVAVFEIENRGTSLTKDELTALSDYLGNKLAEQGNYQIIPRDEIRKRILSQKESSYKACYDQHCQIEIGRELAAQFTVSSSVSKVGTICLVNSALYDLRKAATAKTATAEGGCTPEELFGALKKVAIRLGKSEQAEYHPPPRKEPKLTEETEKPYDEYEAGSKPGQVRFTSCGWGWVWPVESSRPGAGTASDRSSPRTCNTSTTPSTVPWELVSTFRSVSTSTPWKGAESLSARWSTSAGPCTETDTSRAVGLPRSRWQ